MMLRPDSDSSCARIAPVQPKPTIRTSTFGSGVAISTFAPIRPAADGDRRQGIRLAVALDEPSLIVASAGKTNQFPTRHVSVAAVQRIGKESFLHVLQEHGEERLAVDAIRKLRCAV